MDFMESDAGHAGLVGAASAEGVEDSSVLAAAAGVAQLLPDGLITVDAHGAITLVNLRAEQILERQGEVLVGRSLCEALVLFTRSGEQWWEVADPWRSLGSTTGHREKLLTTETGVEVLVSARYLRRERGGPISSVVIALRDAEARRRAEQDHAALISTIAHELRSPLTGVKGFSATLINRWDDLDETQRHHMVEAIDADADRLTRLITDLLDVSRIDAGRLRIHEVPIPTEETMRRHIARYLAAGHDESVFKVEVREGAEEVYADPDRLDQVISNLLENALRHKRSQVMITAETWQSHHQPGVRISVRDDGPGIPEAQRRAVFNRFWHGRSGSGTGLGLYIVKGIVEAHEGWAALDEAPDGGAVARVFFPSEPV